MIIMNIIKHGAIDGNAVDVNANYGFAVGKNGGYFNLAGSFTMNGKTFRQDNGTASNKQCIAAQTAMVQ